MHTVRFNQVKNQIMMISPFLYQRHVTLGTGMTIVDRTFDLVYSPTLMLVTESYFPVQLTLILIAVYIFYDAFIKKE